MLKIPQYPTFEVNEPEEPLPPPHPIWPIMNCVSLACSLTTINSILHMVMIFGWQKPVPYHWAYAIVTGDFICALSVILFLYFNKVDDGPTND